MLTSDSFAFSERKRRSSLHIERNSPNFPRQQPPSSPCCLSSSSSSRRRRRRRGRGSGIFKQRHLGASDTSWNRLRNNQPGSQQQAGSWTFESSSSRAKHCVWIVVLRAGLAEKAIASKISPHFALRRLLQATFSFPFS